MTPTILPLSWTIVRLALGQVESGNNDYAWGAHAEISRYQIRPNLWRSITHSNRYMDNKTAWSVAKTILIIRKGEFIHKMDRLPNPAELYALWNAPNTFRRRNYNWRKLPKTIKTRCEQFNNLYDDLSQAKNNHTLQP